MDSVQVVFEGLGLTFNIKRVAFTIGEITVYWYGVIIALGFLLAILYAIRNSPRFGLDPDRVIDVAIGSIIAGIIGARLYYVLFSFNDYKDDPISIFKIWEGGLAILGGVIGALIVAVFLCRWRKISFKATADMASIGLLVGQGIGRWGNYLNQEAFGTNTTLPWGMYSSETYVQLAMNQAKLAENGITVDPTLPVHPCFLYESLWCLLGCVLLYLYINKRRFDGEMILMYAAWYGFGRFFIEGLRVDSLMLGKIRVSQLLSALICIAAIVAIIIIRSKIKRNKDPEYLKLYCKTEESIAMLEDRARLVKEEKEKRAAKKSKNIVFDEVSDDKKTAVDDSLAEDIDGAENPLESHDEADNDEAEQEETDND